MAQNLWWAAGYNVVAIPLAAGVFAPWGIVLHPPVGAVLMSLSNVVDQCPAAARRTAVNGSSRKRSIDGIRRGIMRTSDCRCAKRSSFDGRVRGQSRLHRPLRVGPAVPVLLAVGALIGAGKRTFPRAQEHHGHTFRCC